MKPEVLDEQVQTDHLGGGYPVSRGTLVRSAHPDMLVNQE